MVDELTAVPVAAAASGISIWFWVAALFLALFVLVTMFLVLFALKMRPVMPYWRASRKGEDMTFLGLKSGRLKLVTTEYIAGLFHSAKLNLSWIKSTPESFRFGEVNAIIAYDDWGITVDPKRLKAVSVILEKWNASHVDEKGPYNQIESYDDLVYLIEKGYITDPVLIPAVSYVSLGSVRKYLQEKTASALEGHINTRVQYRLGKQSNKMPGWLKTFLFCEIFLIVIAFVGYIILNSHGG